jgi:hypothetical protein
METYGIDFLTPSFVIYASKQHHHHHHHHQIHRETITIIASDDNQIESQKSNKCDEKVVGAGLENLGGRRKRVLKCYLRLCGSMRSPESARECAEAQIQHTFLCGGSSRASKSQQPPLVWRKFSGFEAIPSQHTGIYCNYLNK